MTIILENFFRYFDETNVNQVAAVKLLASNIPQLLVPESAWVIAFRGKQTSDPVVLQNFFHYFSEKNPNHLAGVAQLQKDLPSIFLQDTSDWVVQYRKKPPVPSEINLAVPYYSQVDNYTFPERSCNSSSCAMCLEYLKPGTLIGPKGDDSYLRKVLSIGDTTDHSVQTQVLKSYGVNSSFSYNLGFDDIEREIKAGRPVVIGILHRGPLSNPTGGHMIVVRGLTTKGDFYINDPYGSLNDSYGGPVENGKNTVYTRDVLRYRWLENNKDKTGWGRIFTTNPPSTPTTSSDFLSIALEIIKKFEGCSLSAYPDPGTGGKPFTIGWGSTRYSNGSEVKMGDNITQAQADQMLLDSVKNEFLPEVSKIPYWSQMTASQKAALIDFAYNNGANFMNSGNHNTISKALREKRWADVPNALLLYVNPGSSVQVGLTRRRQAEIVLWNK